MGPGGFKHKEKARVIHWEPRAQLRVDADVNPVYRATAKDQIGLVGRGGLPVVRSNSGLKWSSTGTGVKRGL